MLSTPEPDTGPPLVDDAGFARLAALREGIRRYLAWAEQCARAHEMTTAQVQLALAIRSHPEPEGPNLTRLSETLFLRHHSVIGLVDRAEDAGIVIRVPDPQSANGIRVRLTESGADRLAKLSALHLDWLAEHAPEMASVWGSFGPTEGTIRKSNSP